MSRNIWTVFNYELLRNLRRRGYLFTTFGIPIIGVFLLVGLPLLTGGGGNPTEQFNDLQFELEGIDQAGYVDFSGAFPEPGPLAEGVLIPYETEDAAREALRANQVDVFYTIPEDYLETGEVTLTVPRFSIAQVTSTPIEQLFYSQFVDSLDETTLQRLVNPAQVEIIDTQTGEESQFDPEAVNNTITQIFAILLVFALLGTNGYLMQSVIEEKETRLVEILLSSVRPVHLLVGKIFALGLLGLFQLVVYVVAIIIGTNLAGADSIFSSISIPFDVLVMVVIYFVLGYLLFAALFGAVGAISTSLSEGPTYTIFFVIPAMLPWIFATEFASDPNGPLATAFSLIPITAPMGMVMRFAVLDNTVPVIDVVISIALLVVAIVFMMWFAGRLFRVQTLLSGKVPSLRDIPKLVRG